MKFIDEIDIELVNQELNFNSQDNSLVIKGGCDLFTTKPIGSDRKLFKTIDKHLDQIIEDNQLSRSIEWERKNSVHSLFGSSASPPASFINRRDSYSTITERDRRQSSGSSSITNFSKSFAKIATEGANTNPGNISIITSPPSSEGISNNHNNNLDNGNGTATATSLLTNSLKDETSFELDPLQHPIDESPFGPLKNVTTRKTFAYLIAILNTTFPDHDFSNLQPTTENFHRIHNPEDLIHRFNNIMISLGKKEDILNWIWDTINVYMDVSSPIKNSPSLSAQSGNGGPILTNSRKNSFNNNNNNNGNNSHPYARSSSTSSNNGSNSPPLGFNPELCQIYQFQPSDESILEDLNYPYQTMWSYYWFIYNKKKKRVAFVYLTAINQIHYSTINSSNGNGMHNSNRNSDKEIIRHEDDDDIDVVYDDDDGYLDEDAILDDDDEGEDNDVIGDIEI